METASYDLTLSPPAGSFKSIMKMRSREKQPDMQELVEALERDPVMAAHLLRQVNSPFYSLRQSVTALDRAITMLGFDAVCNTLFVETYTKKREGIDAEEARGAYDYIVRTSVAAAALAKDLARFLKMADRATVMTSALLHQLGRFALLAGDPVAYSTLWRKMKAPSGREIYVPPGIGREIIHFRTDYMRLGAEIARKWELPADLRESIRYHSDPERVEDADRKVVLIVAVSQQFARTVFEPREELNRDQSATRVQKALVDLAKEYGVGSSEIESFLDEQKFHAFESANKLELF